MHTAPHHQNNINTLKYICKESQAGFLGKKVKTKHYFFRIFVCSFFLYLLKFYTMATILNVNMLHVAFINLK